MKNLFRGITVVGLLAVAALSFNNPAKADEISGVNCAALTGSPLMCIKNQASAPVVGVQAVSGNIFNPNAWIHVPGGSIAPGNTTIVKFNAWSGGCNQHVFIQLADGRTHMYPYTDVCRSTSFLVTGGW